MQQQNLNLFTRRELLDTLKLIDSGLKAANSLQQTLASAPHIEIPEGAGEDQFLVEYDLEIIETIAIEVESYAWNVAEVYSAGLEQQDVSEGDAARFNYWQGLCEKWGYLELTLSMS